MRETIRSHPSPGSHHTKEQPLIIAERIHQVTMDTCCTDISYAGMVPFKGTDAGAGVLCKFVMETMDKKIKTGKTVNLKGICYGIWMDVVLTQCSVVEQVFSGKFRNLGRNYWE
jgi:hypothetical protein